VDLTLAGHTHGGQAALAGRSILTVASPEKYPWGVYAKGRSRLHVTSGVGQWFPFRFGCPPETVILELRRG
jgi:predicted MPP superfamily phosphohydrolase